MSDKISPVEYLREYACDIALQTGRVVDHAALDEASRQPFKGACVMRMNDDGLETGMLSDADLGLLYVDARYHLTGVETENGRFPVFHAP